MKKQKFDGFVYDCLDRTNPSAPEKARKALGMEKKVLKIKYKRDGGFVPQKAHEMDAGLDLKTPENVVIPARGAATIDTKVCIFIPEGYVGMLKSKSGLNVKHGIRGEGVIDAGYTGHIVAKLYNDSDRDYFFSKGDKIIQMVIMPIPQIEMEEGEAEDTERGSNGFGSSGR